ncbi:beta-lactamase-like protein, partial [Usnea florida]
MSTFRGVVEVDYFRRIPGRDNPLACFLSHVHSDHLQGLESFRSTFIYCSPTTRELLLRLEKKSHRIHFRQGLLESRKQTYKHLTRLMTIPLNAPTEIELKPGISLRVTLLDANHCAGAVMFLIENDTKAILYTGDIRSEPWWVNSLIRNPVILPYAHGIRRLNKIYLDTTFASKSIAHRRFPTKEDGLKELLEKVRKYPIDTCFHLHAWTFGYEDVWIALSSALRSQIHLDEYNYSLYESLGTTAKDKNLCYEGPALYGFECANNFQNGCLTPKENVRLHSCQRELGCSALAMSNVVYIRPILSRSHEGIVLHELGAGGGGGDLNQVHKLELNDAATVRDLIEMCKTRILDDNTRSSTIELIIKAQKFGMMDVPLDILDVGRKDETTQILLSELPELLAKLVAGGGKSFQESLSVPSSHSNTNTTNNNSLDQEFPYSRHSSYEELCNLVKAFEPVDVYPCTIHEGYEDLSVSIECLFGHLCIGPTFSHDEEMKLLASQRENLKRCANDPDLQTMTSSREQNAQVRDRS